MLSNIKVSYIIPTYNSERVLQECLEGIKMQKFPQEQMEIIIVDGFSKDSTREIAKKFNCIIIDNKEMIHPKGRPIGIKQAKGEFICCLDSDNIIIEKDWITKMLAPLEENKNIVASEPLYYLSRESDNLLTKYIAFSGVDDPLVLEIGNYDRYSKITNKWTKVPIEEINKNNYRLIKFKNKNLIPSLGANGTIFRTSELLQVEYNPFHHIDISHKVLQGENKLWAKVECGIVHKHGDNIFQFIIKKSRRISRRLDKNVHIGYYYPIKSTILIKVLLKSIFLFPIFESLLSFAKTKSIIALIHPFMYYFVFINYSMQVFKNLFLNTKGNDYEKVQ